LERLNNPAFAQKVPVNVLAEHQKRLAEGEESSNVPSVPCRAGKLTVCPLED